MGVPDALAQEVGAKVWVTGSSGADGVAVQSYGIIRAELNRTLAQQSVFL